MKRTLLNYGIAGGVIGSLLFLGPILFAPDSYMDPENYGTGEVVGYSVMILSMLPVYFGTRAYRNKYFSDSFSFGKALGSALLITLLASIVFYLANVLVYEVLVPDFLTEFGENYKHYMLSSAGSEAEKEEALAKFNAEAGLLENGYLYGLVMASSVFFIGVIISLITAMILRKK